MGSKDIKVNKEREPVVKTALGEVRFTKPVAYQEVEGTRADMAVNHNLPNSEHPTPN